MLRHLNVSFHEISTCPPILLLFLLHKIMFLFFTCSKIAKHEHFKELLNGKLLFRVKKIFKLETGKEVVYCVFSKNIKRKCQVFLFNFLLVNTTLLVIYQSYDERIFLIALLNVNTTFNSNHSKSFNFCNWLAKSTSFVSGLTYTITVISLFYDHFLFNGPITINTHP